QLVLDAEELAPAGGEVAPAAQAHGLPSGGPVERLGDGGPPVDDHRLLGLVGDRDPADVEGVGIGRCRAAGRRAAVAAAVARVAVARRARRAVGPGGPGGARLEVDAAEAQGGVAQVELLEAGEHRVPEDVALV